MIALLLGLALASPCDDTDGGLATGFATVNPRPGDLGSGRRLCHRDEAAGGIAGSAVIDADDFYGLLGAAVVADGSIAATERVEVFGGLGLFRYDTLISAFSDSAIGPGHTWLGASGVLAEGERGALGLDGRLVLPTAFALYRHAWPVAADVGVAGMIGTPAVRGHGRVGLLASAALSRGPAAPWLGGTVRLGAELRPGDHFAFVLDLDTTLGYAGSSGLEAVALAPEFRFAIARKLGISLGAWVPVVAPDRQPLGIELRMSGRTDGG